MQPSCINHYRWNVCITHQARPHTVPGGQYSCVFTVPCLISSAKKSSSKKTPTPFPHHLSLVESLLVTDRQSLWHPALVIEGNYKPWRELWQWGKLLYSPPPGALTCRHTEINCYKTSDELDAHMCIVKLLERRRMKQYTSCDAALMLVRRKKKKEKAAKRSSEKTSRSLPTNHVFI